MLLSVYPQTAYRRLILTEIPALLRRLDNKVIIVERMSLDESEAIREKREAISELRLDHTLPLQLGGSNSRKNIKLVPIDIWESYTPIENHLGRLRRAGEIDKKKAQQLSLDFKNGKISSEEVIRSAAGEISNSGTPSPKQLPALLAQNL